MSFEKKYERYKNPGRYSAPKGYVDHIAGKVSDRIGSSRPATAYRVWALSFSAVAVLAIGWFLLPTLNPATDGETPLTAQSRTVGSHTAQMSEMARTFAPDLRDSFAASEKTAITRHVKTLQREDIVEYLLDEGYEEI